MTTRGDFVFSGDHHHERQHADGYANRVECQQLANKSDVDNRTAFGVIVRAMPKATKFKREKFERRSVSMPPSYWQKAERLAGNNRLQGNVCALFRELLDKLKV